MPYGTGAPGRSEAGRAPAGGGPTHQAARIDSASITGTCPLAKLAIFIDGGYLSYLAEHHFRTWVDFGKLSNKVQTTICERTNEPLDLLRTYFYDCLPYQSSVPTEDEERRFSSKKRFFFALQRLPRYKVREGRLMHRGIDSQGKPIFQQKRVDLMVGLDIANLAAKRQINHAAVISGDGDLLPAVEAAQQEGVLVWLVHGPQLTYAEELWDLADDRLVIDADFMKTVEKVVSA